MNNTFAFNNVDEFKELFGYRETGTGELVRKNKIVLGFLRDYNLHKYVRDDMWMGYRDYFFKITNVSDLYDRVVSTASNFHDSLNYVIPLLGVYFTHNTYTLDEFNGICEDGDIHSIRYINHENNRVYKKKAGRFFKELILNSEFGRHLPESTLLYICEEFSRRWETFAQSRVRQYDLVVDDDFESIYSGSKCCGSFGSCMTDSDQYYFYSNAVSAKAASLRKEDGTIMARCIIFTKVHEAGSDKIWRLAERQYASDGDELLKRQLVDALIRGGYIDGYKKVGAGCHDSRQFVDNDGNSLYDKKFWIRCDLEDGNTLSYQDSFKFYYPDDGRACNTDLYGSSYDGLDTTEDTYYRSERAYDDYHDYYCDETRTVYYHGSWVECDVDNLDDFVWCDQEEEYYHVDDVQCCEHCDEYFPAGHGYHSDVTGKDYCCEDCRYNAEVEYKELNWHYAEIDDEYFEDEDDVATVFIWSDWCNKYVERTISQDLLEDRIGTYYHEYEGEYYDTLEHIDAA